MAKYTTTLYEIIKAEFIRQGLNEFVNRVNGKTQITYNNDDFAFIKKIMTYDQDTKNTCNNILFNGYQIDPEFDDYFKKTFLNRFYMRQIKFQTVEVFRARLFAYLSMNEVRISMYLNHLRDYYSGGNQSTTKTNTQDTQTNFHNRNAANKDLPQDQVDLDVDPDITTWPYANTNDILREKGGSTDNTTTETDVNSTAYSPAVFAQLDQLFNDLFNEIDRACFLQIA